MKLLNFEFKAKAADIKALENKLLTLDPLFIGEDRQTDTYFNVPSGRLKLREGNIENSLIWYERENAAAAKQSDILLYKHAPDESLKNILEKIHGIKVVVSKTRRIYFLQNVKFHFDNTDGLGSFIETEAIDETGEIGIENLKAQCDHYAAFFGISAGDFIDVSYSDLLLQKMNKKDG